MTIEEQTTPAAPINPAPINPAPMNTVTWWEIPVGDLADAKTFYGDVFGWTYQSFGSDDDYIGIMNGGDLVGGLFRADDATTTGIRVYVNVEDIETVLAAVESAGGKIGTPRTEVGGDMGWWGDFTDPSGQRIGVCSGNPAR